MGRIQDKIGKDTIFTVAPNDKSMISWKIGKRILKRRSHSCTRGPADQVAWRSCRENKSVFKDHINTFLKPVSFLELKKT